MNLQKEIIKECKFFIDIHDLGELQNFYKKIIDYDMDYNPNFAFIFKEVFLYACLKKDKSVISWMMEIFNTFDDITKIGLRQMFFYGKYLIKEPSIKSWYENNIIIHVRN